MSANRVFESQLEQLMPAEELLFPSTAAFGKYRRFLSQSISHPAKFNTKLLEFLIRKHTREGETVLDCMAGSGSTGIVSVLNNRNAVLVELEEKFFKWIEEAKDKVEKHQSLAAKGRMVNIHGDARNLSQLLQQNPDAILVSPPYSEALSNNAGGRQKRTLTNSDQLSIEKGLAAPYSEDPLNIGNLSHGSIDAVVTSPPYADSFRHSSQDSEKRIKRLVEVDRKNMELGKKWAVSSEEAIRRQQKMQDEGYGKCSENIGNLPHGSVDAVITSPPFADTNDRKDRKMDQTRGIKGRATDLPTSPDNIGNLPIDAVITSPPYADAISRQGGNMENYRCGISTKTAREYSLNPENIGNTSKETYLEAMLKVYQEMFQVLKPLGLAMIAIRPFIRNKQVIDLPFQTWLLMQKVGFTLAKLYKLRLVNQSFWRIIYSKKNPLVPLIAHEYVLVCQKVIR